MLARERTRAIDKINRTAISAKKKEETIAKRI